MHKGGRDTISACCRRGSCGPLRSATPGCTASFTRLCVHVCTAECVEDLLVSRFKDSTRITRTISIEWKLLKCHVFLPHSSETYNSKKRTVCLIFFTNIKSRLEVFPKRAHFIYILHYIIFI